MLRAASATLLALALVSPTSAQAQTQSSMQMSGMATPKTLIEAELQHTTSGTSIEPASTPTPMLMSQHGAWTLMLHGTAFITDTQQQAKSPRGEDKLFSTNWIMPMAQRQLGPNGEYGQLTLRAMFSLEPATVTSRQFPELFQQGETAFGKPIIDGQHPHDFFMELGALYDIKPTEHTLISFYAGPVGDPAIGPIAYPHRISASEDPLAALGHHQEDSTHIAFNVLTAGVTWRWLRFEESGFHGGEPSEQRWGFQPSSNGHAIDSYSSRITFSPTQNLTSQYSIAHITSPEALYPGEDQQRQTASIMYNRPIGAHHNTTSMPGMNMNMDMTTPATGNWSTTLLWGRTKSLTDGSKENSYLLESLLQFHTRNYLWTRIENAGRSNELLLTPGEPLPPHFEESPIGHVAAYSFGYGRDFRIAPHLVAAPGGQFTTYSTPSALVTTYGRHPYGVALFVRFRIAQ
ncbi:hypothetical protein GCM10011507_08690 [Edaphobacter acidisoli]|uniref:Porin n=1 Tax=Edaphobacter acidisoli TaxID=2040573 RepID=A0A916RML5_9BACT|nr:hypothetical protein [Edaphobacter acidisoli]GGA59507.1 hypothetical protein GCM10011507_08690 [Edaphobacter acidisoli]